MTTRPYAATDSETTAGQVPVLQVVLSLNPGGTERLVLDLVKALHRTGFPMAVCCLDEPGAWSHEARDHGVDVHALGRTPGFHPSLGVAIARLAARHQSRVVHAHHYSPFVYAGLGRLVSPTLRVIYTEHGRVADGPPSPKRRLANRALFKRLPARVYTVSADLRDHIAAEGFAADRISVIYNGIRPGPVPDGQARHQIRSHLGAGARAVVIGTIARLDPVKNLGALIDAAVASRHTDPVHVVIVGDGPERAALERRAAATNLADRIHFLGRRDDARDWLAGCDLFVNCSTSEGVSLTILEAMAAALPVVVTAVGGTPEVVTPECGVLVPSRDVAALRAAIDRLGADPDERRRMGLAGRARVETLFTLDRMIGEYRDVYREVS